MFCRNCQTIIPDDSIFCENCGAPTGLDPDQIDDSNLVPEDAVDYEIVEDEEPIRTASVPVDPVWWEPPEDGDEPIDVDIIAEFPDLKDSAEEKETEEPETEEAKESAPPLDETADYRWYPKEGEKSPIQEDEDHGSDGTDEEDWNTIDETEPSLAESALEAAEAAGNAVKSWASKTLKAAKAAREAAKEERKEREAALKAAEAAEEAAKKAAEAAEEAEDTARAAEDAENSAWDAAEAAEEAEDTVWDAAEAAEEAEDTVWDATEAVKAAVEAAVEAEETEDAGKAEKPALDEIMDFRWNPDAGEDTGFQKFGGADLVETDREEPETEEPSALEELKKFASNAAEQAKPYAEKAIVALGELGKTVRTGTEKAAEAAKEQFQQRKEEFQEQKEQRDLQKEQEQKEKALEQRRRENERLRELERQREEELRDNRTVIQQPGFWYGDDMPKSAADSVPARKADNKPEHAPAEETDKGVAFGKEDAPANAAKEGNDAPETAKENRDAPGEKKQGVDAPKDSKPEPLKENVIEDKLADTACFRWSADDLEKAAAGETDTEADADTENGETGRQEEYAWNEGVSEDADENLIPVSTHTDDEPAIYRIKDFVTAPSRKGPGNSSILRIAVVIVVILILIAVIAGVAIHKAHEREEAEAAYQAELKQAHQLVKKEKYDEAEAEYLSLMDQRPEDLNPYLGLAQMYIDQERYLDAEALIDRAVEATGDKKAFAQMKKDIDLLTDDAWKDGYVKVLEDNESDIRKYEETVQASCAVCDVNGDLKPELFFFTREYYGYGKLHIYTTVDDKAKEVDYECKNRGTQYQDAFYDVSSDDSSYAVFNCDEKGKFAIYCNVGHGGRSWDTTNEYELNLTGGCKQTKVIESSIVPTYDEGDEDRSEYLIDDEDISYEKYVAEFKRIINESDQVILYNGNGGDQAVWAKVKPDSVMCMSYDALMSDLKTKDDED